MHDLDERAEVVAVEAEAICHKLLVLALRRSQVFYLVREQDAVGIVAVDAGDRSYCKLLGPFKRFGFRREEESRRNSDDEP